MTVTYEVEVAPGTPGNPGASGAIDRDVAGAGRDRPAELRLLPSLDLLPSLSQAAHHSATRLSKTVTVPAHMLPHRSPAELLTIARLGLAEARQTPADGLRYATAHLAALRAAAAVLAALARPEPRRRSRLTSVWALLTTVAPELGEWSAFFAAGASKRAAAEAGIPRAVTAREADDLTRAAEQFIEVVAVSLGLAYQPVLEGLAS